MGTLALLAAVWIPGKKWTPAWVAWRTGGRYIGWALLPPEVNRIQADRVAAFHLRVDVSRSQEKQRVPAGRPSRP